MENQKCEKSSGEHSTKLELHVKVISNNEKCKNNKEKFNFSGDNCYTQSIREKSNFTLCEVK